MKNPKKFDKYIDQHINDHIRQRVQAEQQTVPPELDLAIMEDLAKTMPLPVSQTHQSRQESNRPLYRTALLAAATILLAVMIVFFFIFIQQSNTSSRFIVEAGEVEVQDVYLEDEAASTIMMNAKDPDIMIIWVEKIKEESSDEKID